MMTLALNLVIRMATKAKGKNWQAKVKGLLKAELARRGLTYAGLADKLSAIGIRDNERNISNKISRGTFTAVFFVQCMEAIGAKTIHLENGS
jgi:hypothetical protein